MASAPSAPANEVGSVAIECHRIEKRFGHLEALRGADLTVRFGQILALLGDNGAGKSTLIKCISGAYVPDGGEIRLIGEPTHVQSTRHAQALGIQTIYQDLALAPDLSILDNVFLGRELTVPGWRGRLGILARAQMHDEATEAVRRIGVRISSVRLPVRDLSGGQRQAVAVAKAMQYATTAILMDEPTAALGARQRQIVYEAARSAAENGLGVVMVSHDIPQMLVIADRVAVMRHGVVVAEQPASELDQKDVMALMLGDARVSPVVEPETTGAEPTAAERDDTRYNRWRALWGSPALWVFVVLIGLVVFFGLATPQHAFFQLDNFLNVALDAAELLLLATGMTYLLGAGQLDLSIGSNVLLSSVVAAKVITALGGTTSQIAEGNYPHLGLALAAGVPAALATGLAFGLVNGLIVTKLKINSFIATLATMGIGLGTTYVATHGTDVPYLPLQLQSGFGINKIGGVLPLPVIVSAVFVAVFWYILAATRYGIRTLAIGSSREAAERAGIPVDRHLILLFVQMGMFAAVAAIIDISRFGTTNVAGHQTDNLQAIAAAVIGGTSLFGGIASVGGAIVGTMIPVTLTTGLILMSIDPFYQLIAIGVILLFAVYFQERRRGRYR